ncbi:hypothetical protein QOV31_005244 (plasmid) [Agrobacterium fabrum]|uniref:hypothetical protein n=1 Tax=Rhizobium/Agrobacterium group TaxID=227290 RepID=UPI000A6FFFA6|nr:MULTISPECIES: hypothetical protein [Rhizobium/Agrobacterium group]NMV72344.1 hypothetical protein [Agrobacterium fabrum]NTF72657.1 hypothetical protein [Rhizobium rhizogenes]NTI85370.1 hypothetical protein [Rhizobium rhizogenes]NTJ27553.1 hypothetical protein [Rhizobium rhizogenes]QRM41742.1 hypothetical protein F3X89_28285 [Rhizobium rhizogenes]
MPANDATCAAAIAFPEGNWKEELDALRTLCDPVEVVKVAVGRGLSGICNVVAAMNPTKVRGLGDVIGQMPALNHRIAAAAGETPVRDLGIGYQCAICHPDIASAMLATSEGISHVLRERIEKEVDRDIGEGATVCIFVQPRMSSKGSPVSVHFTLQFARSGTLVDARMMESYNFMKGNGTVTAPDLKSHWKKHGIDRPGPRPPTSKFELLFAAVPDNSKLAATDFTHLGPVERDKELLGSTVFGIAAKKPGTIVYPCEKVLCLEVDVQAHRALEVLHRLGEQAYSNGRGTSFGLHTGPSSCLNLSAAALATFFKRSDLCSLPLSDAFVLFCDHATGAYSAKKDGLPITAFSPTSTNQFELVEPQVVKAYVLGLFDAPTMVTPRDKTRASFCSQYVRFREPHPCEEFNEIGVLILDAAAKMLERYAKFLEDGGRDDDEMANIIDVFGFCLN